MSTIEIDHYERVKAQDMVKFIADQLSTMSEAGKFVFIVEFIRKFQADITKALRYGK